MWPAHLARAATELAATAMVAKSAARSMWQTATLLPPLGRSYVSRSDSQYQFLWMGANGDAQLSYGQTVAAGRRGKSRQAAAAAYSV